ncbi:MAG: hypothetical protein ACYC0L_02020 [Thermoleophilia bacterium]
MIVITGGLWLFTLPLYPKRCIQCGSEWTEAKAYRRRAKRGENQVLVGVGYQLAKAQSAVHAYLNSPRVQPVVIKVKDFAAFRRMILKSGRLREFKTETLPGLVRAVIQVVFWVFTSLLLFVVLLVILSGSGLRADLVSTSFCTAYLVTARLLCEGLMLLFRVSMPNEPRQ